VSEAGIGRWLLVAAAVVVIATVIAAVATMGLPSTQRDIGLDERRVHDLQRISTSVRSYAETSGALAPDLATVAAQPGHRLAIIDPGGAPYSYERSGDRTFRLCAVFVTDTAQPPQAEDVRIADEWLHGTGRQCFQRRLKQDPSDD
jgi:hypothetical protein